MSFRTTLLSVTAASLLAVPAFADGGPTPEPAPPPPPPPPAEEPAPEPAPPPPPPAPSFVPGWYVEGEGGVTFSGDLNYGCCEFEMDMGWNAGGAIGYHASPNFDVEIDVFYAQMGYDGFDTNISGLSTMVDLIYNFDMGAFVDPYIGAGVGAIRVRYDGEDQFPDFTGSEWEFGYQAMAGLMMNVASNTGLFVEYRWHDATGDGEIEGVTDIEYHSHNVSAGLQFSF